MQARSLDLIIDGKFLWLHALGPSIAIPELRRFGGHLIERRHAGDDKDVSADRRTSANDRVTAQNCRTGINRYVVFDCGMTLVSALRLTEDRERAERHALVDPDVV